jgi:hypothetical protein
MSVGDLIEETEPLTGIAPVYGPPVALVAIPWLLFGLMLSGPFAVVVTILVALAVVAAAVVLIGAIVTAPFVLLRRLLAHPSDLPRGRVAARAAVASRRIIVP